MENVVTAIFNVESEAYQAFTELRRKPYGEGYVAAEAAQVKREGDTFKVIDVFDAAAITADDTAAGMVVGSLVGILGGPLGVLLGAYTGTVTGAAFDAADTIDSLSLMEATAAKLYDGDVAIIALVQEDEPAFDAALEGFDAQIIRHFAVDVMDEVDRALEVEAELANLAKQEMRAERKAERAEKRAERKASVQDYFSTLKDQYDANKAERAAKFDAHLDDLADKANAATAKLAEIDQAGGEAIAEAAAKKAEVEAEIAAKKADLDAAVDEASAAFVSEAKEIMGE